MLKTSYFIRSCMMFVALQAKNDHFIQDKRLDIIRFHVIVNVYADVTFNID